MRMVPSYIIRGCTGEMAKIYFSCNNYEICQSCREWRADNLSLRHRNFFLTGRSSFSVKRVGKVDFTSKSTSDWTHTGLYLPPMTTKLTRIVDIGCLSTRLKFGYKIMSGRFPFYRITGKKSVFTSDSTSDSTSQAHISASTWHIDPRTSPH